MDNNKQRVTELDKVAVRFSGDSGDGMQLAGNIFTNVSAGLGNSVSTFPDYPAEIRAPQGSLGGVSGFQVSIGAGVHTPGDKCDVLVAMNPAALKQNYKFLKPGGVIITDVDSFREEGLKKAQFSTDDPIKELGITAQVVEVPVTSMTKAALADSGMDIKSVLKCRNIFTLGLICWLFDRPVEAAVNMIRDKFAKKPAIAEANTKVILAGFDYGHNIHASVSTYKVQTEPIVPGTYTDIKGNQALAWGLIEASEKAHMPLFLGSYPITPATDILHELAKRKDLGVKACQMEDEIAGVCSAIGASFAGSLAATSTSGAQKRGYRSGRDGRTSAGGNRRDARRSLDRSPHKDRADRPRTGTLRPQRRKPACSGGSRFAHRLLQHGFRGLAHRSGTHHSRHPSGRCFHRQRLIGMAHPRRQ